MCSMLVVTRRPRGPRNVRPDPETSPKPTRRPLPPGFASAKTGWPIAGRSVGPRDRGRAGGVDRDHGDVAVDVDAGDCALGRAPVAEDDRACLAPHVVRVRQHLSFRHDDAAAEASEADDGGTDLLCDPLDACLEFV